jgi:hypothetical protein
MICEPGIQAPRIGEPEPNTITRPYRGLSVQEVDIPLTPEAIAGLLSGREIYRRTAYLVLRSRGQTALVAVRPENPDRLFSPVAELRVLSGPATTAWIDQPAADVGNATSLAAAALAHRRDGVLAYVVRGRYEHVNFIWRPAPLAIRVTEVIPPHPPKLLAMAEQVVGYDEDLPPLRLILDAVDVRELVAANPAAHYLLPCRGGGLPAGPQVSFLDCHPAYHADWLLIGCERSRQFHQHFYGSQPRRVDLCPRARVAEAAQCGGPPSAAWADASREERVLAKCCLLERGIEVDGATAVVPWGATLDEVRAALRALCGIPPAAVPAGGTAAAAPGQAAAVRGGGP